MRADALRTVTRPAMGADVTITTDASPIAVEAALAVVATLERRWTRFDPESELSRINDAAGPAVARPSTARVVEMALAGRSFTDGWFDPTRGRQIEAAGYRDSLEHGWSEPADPAHSAGDVDVDGASGLIDVPSDLAIDLGGIVKGWTADMATGLLADAGASHAGVSIGGDLRIRSRTRAIAEIEAPDPTRAAPPALVALRDGGVAVSGPTKRRAGDGRHHLIDPTTGRPASCPRVAVVVAATSAGAEMLATAASVAPQDAAVRILERAGATAWLVEADGRLTTIGTPERFMLEAGWLGAPSQRAWSTT
ncbi:MAG: FAD:protein FMN transferase [Actinomycetota bacterium]